LSFLGGTVDAPRVTEYIKVWVVINLSHSDSVGWCCDESIGRIRR